jgi:carbon storage regulator CsrA
MLVLGRFAGEAIVVPSIGLRITVTHVDLRTGAVKLGFEAAPGVKVWREELTTGGRLRRYGRNLVGTMRPAK